MIVFYEGYEVEGTVEEIKELLGKREEPRVTAGDAFTKVMEMPPMEMIKVDKRKGRIMSEAHKEKIKEGIRKYNERGRTPWHKTSKKQKRWAPDEEVKLKYLRLEKGIKNKEVAVELNRTLEQVKNKIKDMRLRGRWPKKFGVGMAKKSSIRLTTEQEEYILKSKESNTPYIHLVLRFNRKFGTNYTQDEIKDKYYEIKYRR